LFLFDQTWNAITSDIVGKNDGFVTLAFVVSLSFVFCESFGFTLLFVLSAWLTPSIGESGFVISEFNPLLWLMLIGSITLGPDWVPELGDGDINLFAWAFLLACSQSSLVVKV